MKQTPFLRIDATDRIRRHDLQSPIAPPDLGYGLGISDGTGNAVYISIGEREVDVPVIADKLIEFLDAMRWQALQRIAAAAVTDNQEAVPNGELIGNDHTREATPVIYCVCGHVQDQHGNRVGTGELVRVGEGRCHGPHDNERVCGRFVRFAAAFNPPA